MNYPAASGGVSCRKKRERQEDAARRWKKAAAELRGIKPNKIKL
jgi:hypothetical protein